MVAAHAVPDAKPAENSDGLDLRLRAMARVARDRGVRLPPGLDPEETPIVFGILFRILFQGGVQDE